MSLKYGGGPAFPMSFEMMEISQSLLEQIPDQKKRDAALEELGAVACGMSVRDYFLAHAPAEPQHWFQPVMPPCPPDASKPDDLTLEERMEINGYRNETLRLEGMKEPRAIAYVKDASEAFDLQIKWRTEQAKQLWVQWPAAWADEQLKAREA